MLKSISILLAGAAFGVAGLQVVPTFFDRPAEPVLALAEQDPSDAAAVAEPVKPVDSQADLQDAAALPPPTLKDSAPADRAKSEMVIQSAPVIVGLVVAISAGDTLTILDANHVQHTIRIVGIDPPVNGQGVDRNGNEAIAANVLGKQIRVEILEKRGNGHDAGNRNAGDQTANRDFVQEGWAWHYTQRSDSAALAEAMQHAANGGHGPRDDRRLVPPAEFRQAPKSKLVAAPALVPSECAPPAKAPASTAVPDKRNPHGQVVTGYNAKGLPTFTGPRGGVYHYSESGGKVYEKKRK